MDKHIFPLAIVAVIVIFAFDLMHPADIAIWLLYAIPIVFAARSLDAFRIILLTVICTILVIAGFLYFSAIAEMEIALTNRLLGVGVFWIILFLILELKKAVATIKQERDSLESKVRERTAQLQAENAERARVEDALRKSEEEYRFLVEHAPTGIYEIDYRAPRFKSVNESMCQILGYTCEELLKMNPADILDEEGRELFLERIRRVNAGEAIDQSVTYQVITKDGRKIWADINITMLYEDGKQVGALVAAHDVTGRKRIEEERERLIAELEMSYRDLESFSYSVSHDLRAPLGFIRGFSKMIAEEHGDALGENGRTELKHIEENVNRMDQLITGVLAISRAGRQEIQTEELDMADIARSVIHDLRTEYREKSPETIVHELPKAKGDPVLIRQVFANLLSNAFKFTRDKPAPKIEVSGYKSRGENIYFISDNGVGFEMKNADRLFGLFQRLHGEARFEGTGIGLATVQRIIRRHGGRVWAEAEVNEGASFFFTLPEL